MGGNLLRSGGSVNRQMCRFCGNYFLYELRAPTPSQFIATAPGVEHRSNAETDRSRLLLEFNNALVSQPNLDGLLKSIFEHTKQVFRQTIAATLSIHDPIEEKHAEGEPLREALLDAGIMRLRPVLITVGATVIALFPLASHGGPLWEPTCYAQIGGLSVATFVTLLLVPVIYSIFVLDLKLVQWEKVAPESTEALLPAASTAASE